MGSNFHDGTSGLGMSTMDGRSLEHKALERLRRVAVERVLGGEKPRAVVTSLGFYRTSIYKWLRIHRRQGPEGLRSRKAKGPMPRLTKKQRQQVRRWIIGRDPRQYGFNPGLWTRSNVAQMIEDRFGVSLTLPSISGLLASLGIKPRKPLRRAAERRGRAIRQWKVKTYPELRKRAKKGGAEIYFLDEIEARSGSALGRSYGSEWRTAVAKAFRPRERTNVIRVINARGAFRYDVCGGRLTAARFIVSLKRLVTGRKKPVILVVDELPVDMVKSVANYVQSTRGRLELHFLPPYASYLHPDEFVWNHLRHGRARKKQLRRNKSSRQCACKTRRSTLAYQRLARSF